MTKSTNTIQAPAKGIESITHDTQHGLTTVWVSVTGSTNIRAAENIARGYLRKEQGLSANVVYVGRFGTVAGGKHGYKFIGI